MKYLSFSNTNVATPTQVIVYDEVTPLVVLQKLGGKGLVAGWVADDIFPLWDALILHVKDSVSFHDDVAVKVLSYIYAAPGPSNPDNLSKLFDFTFTADLRQDAVKTASTKVRSATLGGALHLMFESSNVLDKVCLTITPKAA